MARLSNIKEWRSAEVVKLFLLKLDLKLIVENSPADFFDFIVSLEQNPEIRFAIIVKSKQRFTERVNKQIDLLTKYRDQQLITIPVFLIKVDDVKEEGEFDFLVFPSFKEEKLLVRYVFRFTALSKSNFIKKLEIIKKWYKILPRKTERETERLRRTITPKELESLAKKEISNSFKGKAVISQIEIVGINQDIISKWEDKINKPLINLFKIRNYLDFAITKAQTVQMLDYDSTTLIEEVEYPSVIQSSEIFKFVFPINESTNQRILASIFSVIATVLESWRISIDNGYTIRGSIDITNVIFNKENYNIIGDADMKLTQLHNLSENDFKVILSNEIRALIRKNLKRVNPSIIDYFRRFIHRDNDNLLILNPALILANNPTTAKESLSKIEGILSNIKNVETKNKFISLQNRVKNADLSLQDTSIFK